jgi:hypothetical protein
LGSDEALKDAFQRAGDRCAEQKAWRQDVLNAASDGIENWHA